MPNVKIICRQLKFYEHMIKKNKGRFLQQGLTIMWIAVATKPIQYNDRLSVAAAFCDCSHSQRLPVVIVAEHTLCEQPQTASAGDSLSLHCTDSVAAAICTRLSIPATGIRFLLRRFEEWINACANVALRLGTSK